MIRKRLNKIYVGGEFYVNYMRNDIRFCSLYFNVMIDNTT